jgi:thioredoxin reductase (NADPH)
MTVPTSDDATNGASNGGSSGAIRTAIVTVDDDPGVSRAVARDLRRRYGQQHRIVRAESGPSALDTLRQMKLRGDTVAVILADYRMPQMNGIEFLEKAMDIYPAARRVLLTAYADTDAAIEAINVVDLDHYLLKPWDPPEEKLYPVVDELLEAWLAADYRPVPETKIVGHRWSARSSQVREFLARNQVPYRWYLADEPEGQRLLRAAGAMPDDATGEDGTADVGRIRLPVVITPDGQALVEPSDAELAGHVGLATTPSKDFYDLIVIGGGPAGLGAAVYGASEGLRTVLVERTATGGQAGQSSRIENYLGFPDGVSGAQLTERARRQAAKFGAEVLTTRDVTGLEVNGSARTVRFADGSAIDAHTVILATGVSYRQLSAPGLGDLTGRGVYYGSALTEAAACSEQDVYIVGGANSAGQAAVYLSRQARSVTLLCRGPSLQQSMSYYLIQQIDGIPSISVRTCTEVIEARGDDHLEQLTLRNTAAGGTETIDAGWLFLFIGAAPRTEWLDGVVTRDQRGFVVAGPDLSVEGRKPDGWALDRLPYHLETSVPGVFVAGDVRAESAKRVASAVGEGAMAVLLVHRYLEKL